MVHFLQSCPGWVPVIDEGTLCTIAYMGEVDLFPTTLVIERQLRTAMNKTHRLDTGLYDAIKCLLTMC